MLSEREDLGNPEVSRVNKDLGELEASGSNKYSKNTLKSSQYNNLKAVQKLSMAGKCSTEFAAEKWRAVWILAMLVEFYRELFKNVKVGLWYGHTHHLEDFLASPLENEFIVAKMS